MCAGHHVSAYMYILINKYVMAEYVCTYCVFLEVICEHESVNIIDHIYDYMCLIKLVNECK